MARLHVVRVFVGGDGSGGNPAGIFPDANTVPTPQRQRVAADLGFSETVFVDSPERGEVRIFTPATELAFAGHPLVGTAYVLARVGTPVTTLRPPAGDVPVWHEDGTTWLLGRPEWSPQRIIRRFDDPGAVDALSGADPDAFDLYAWAWIDQERGLVRARYFAPGLGIDEDEATGSAAVALGARLGRPVTIHQGRGSELLVRPDPEGGVAVGGRVVLDEVREHAAPGEAGA